MKLYYAATNIVGNLNIPSFSVNPNLLFCNALFDVQAVFLFYKFLDSFLNMSDKHHYHVIQQFIF